ncbi:hypothetical protein M407DRAFT_34894 [Tulasnella calospora MUT 4182]|uniref:Uncharacterized protein n=1 Tax=Tulasnella calospora MUT 4182 TaxID=1051891 RepID=A0A0C3PMG0_9AGAM|nr:hypothetical protein M407DRAFT_34894 [Tulasnella calospora MUT 4182]
MNSESQSANDEISKRDDKDKEFDESVLDGYMPKDNVTGYVQVTKARLEAATKLHRLVEGREPTSIQPILNSGVLPDIASMISLEYAGLPVRLNAVLVTVTTGSPEQVSAAIETGALPKFILLGSSSTRDEARDDAIIALGNIGGTSRLLRDTVIREGGLKLLLDISSE